MTLLPITELFLRNLNKLKEEISLCKNETDLWKIQGEIKNSTGNLALHLIGNLNFFIGAQLGKTGYVRNREKEFSEKNVPKEILLKNIDETISKVKNSLEKLSGNDLQNNFPIEFLGKQRTNIEMLFILIAHLNYHLGQINYLRRMNF